MYQPFVKISYCTRLPLEVFTRLLIGMLSVHRLNQTTTHMEHSITVGTGSKTLSGRLKKRAVTAQWTVGATQVLVLFLPVFTDFENDVVLTDAITTKAKPGMRKVGWGLAGFLASLRKSAFYVKIYHFSCCLKAYTLAFQRALENFTPVLTTVK